MKKDLIVTAVSAFFKGTLITLAIFGAVLCIGYSVEQLIHLLKDAYGPVGAPIGIAIVVSISMGALYSASRIIKLLDSDRSLKIHLD